MNVENKISCIVVGEGSLPIKCIEILQQFNFEVQFIVSANESLKEIATKLDVPFFSDLSNLTYFDSVDFIFSINNSIILKKQFTSLAQKMAINYHDAPLPRYAGMYATKWAILNGEKQHGISWHEVVDEIDAGDIVSSITLPILPNDTASSLDTRCFEAALTSFNELVLSIIEKRLKLIPQKLENRTYYPYGLRPDSFGLINHEMPAKSVDALIRATNFGSNYDNEFTLPLLFVQNEYYVVAKASVNFDATGQSGKVIEYNGNRGFYCLDGLILPEIVYDKDGNNTPISAILKIGDQLQIPDKSVANGALSYFKRIAKYEPFWRKQLQIVKFVSWPIIHGPVSPEITKMRFKEDTIVQLNQLFPAQRTDEILTAILSLYFLYLSHQTFGSFGFIPSELLLKINGFEDFFNTWVPINCSIDDSDSVVTCIEKISDVIKKAEKSATFSRSTQIRYPDLRNRASDQPGIIISNALPSHPILKNNNIIYIEKDSFSFHFPTGSEYPGSELIAEGFGLFMDVVANRPYASFNHLKMISAIRSQEMINKINHTISEPVEIADVINCFSVVSEKFAENTAIFDAGKNYTYNTLSHDVEKLSASMAELGIKEGDIVAVVIGRNYNYFVSILATLQCGAAFLPIEPTAPTERISFFCTDALVTLILVDNDESNYSDKISVLNVPEIFKSESAENFQNIFYNPDSIAYIIYTSGSTGIPKGVKISRKALANFISGAIGLYQLTSNDRVLQFSNLAFDASIEEIFGSFCSGATLYLRTTEMLLASELLNFSHLHQISVWDLPTAFWRQIIQSDIYLSSTLPESLRIVIIGGEAVSTNDVALWNEKEVNYRLYNTYGPTETTVVALAFEIKAGYIPEKTVPIGQPLPGYRLYITNPDRIIAYPGITGELLVTGDSVALGYLNREKEQNKAFIWFDTPDRGLQRCYCTGDLVVADMDGLVYYQGRVDGQVKIRGYRVEPGEIEQQICLMDGIETCTVVVSKSSSGDKSLYAFYKTNVIQLSAQTIKEELKKKLPSYMIPEFILQVGVIPLTKNGKIDKENLIRLAKEAMLKGTKENIKPTNATEEFLLSLWKEVLSIESMGIDDDFFDLGGHSLKAVQLIAEIMKQKGINIPLASLIQNSTIRTFAPLLNSDKKDSYWDCLVSIRPAGDKTPLFLIHGAGLNVLLYQSLIHHLKGGRPIFAFQAKGLDGSSEISNNISEMADDYIKEIKKIRPNGPYMLLGFSLGGFIAYDMTKKLSESGNEVCFTGVIDSVSSEAKNMQTPVKKILFKIRSAIMIPIYVSWLLLKEPMAGKLELLNNKCKSIRISFLFLCIRLGIMKKKEMKILRTDGKPMFLSDNIEIAMTEALINYEIKPVPIVLDLFKAGKATFYIPNRKDYGWSRFALNGVVVHTLPGEHSRIFAPPNDRRFAEVLDERLDEIESKMER